MTNYTPRTYTKKCPPWVEANRFDGTLDMARWLEDQDNEHLTVMRTMFSTDPGRRGELSIKVRTPNGELTCRTGDWILNNEHGEWNVMNNHQFRALYAPDDPTDTDDPYNQEEA